MVESFGGRLGHSAPPPRCSPGRRSRNQFRHLGSLEFSKLLIEHADVAVAPGIGFGEHGDDYVRLAWSRTSTASARRRVRSRSSSPRRPAPVPPTTSSAGGTPALSADERSRTHSTGDLAVMAEALRVGIAGLGTVGASVARLLATKAPN
jgi:hypothetical protein